MSLLESLKSKLAARQASCEERYRGLVRQVADGHEPDADVAAEILRAAGKTVEDLGAAVATLHERRRLRALLDQGPGVERELADIAARIEKADAALKAAERKHRETIEPLAGRRAGLEAQLNRLPDARQRLIETCQDASLVAKRGELQAALQEAAGRRFKAEQTYREQSAWAKSWSEGAERGGVGDYERRKAKADAAARTAEAAAVERAEAAAEFTRLEKELAALESAMLEP